MALSNETLTKALRYFAGSKVVADLQTLGEAALAPRMEEQRLTVLFQNIDSFTSATPGLHPSEMHAWVQQYLEASTYYIAKHDGTTVQFFGDTVCAVFGLDQATAMEERACECACASSVALDESADKLESELGVRPSGRIGLHAQEVSVGIVGTNEHRQFSVLGDGVNFASRLSALAKSYDVRVIATESTAASWSRSHQLQALGDVRVKGKDDAISLVALR